MPDATIIVANIGTGLVRRTVTSSQGYYAVPLLPPGEYRALIRKDGFRPVYQSGFTLVVGQKAVLNITLDVGALAEEISVSAGPALLHSEDAAQGQVIDNARLALLPLDGRTYSQLALLSAGTVQALLSSRYGGFSVAGQKTTQNNFMLDGIDNNPVELAAAQRRSEIVQPSIDALQEFEVQTNAFAAEYGRAMGGVVNVTTKSGTNELHGTAFEFLRNEVLDAKNFFDPVDRPKPPFKRNQYGFSIGGPLYLGRVLDLRDKVFWFGDYEGTAIRESSTTTSTIPTLGMRTGDFTDLLKRRDVRITDPLSRDPFPDNIIPQERIDPLARILAGLYPDPLNANVASNFVYHSPRRRDIDKWDVRIDVNPGRKDTVSWRLSKHDLVSPAALILPPPAFGGANDQIVEGTNTGAGWNHVFTPSLILSVRGGWNFGLFQRDNVAAAYELANELGVVSLNEAYGIQGANNSIPAGFSLQTLTGYAGIGLGSHNPVDRDSQNRQIAVDLTWSRGKHIVKAGTNIIRSQNNIFNIRDEIGNYFYNARFTGDGIGDLLLGWGSAYIYSTRLQVDLRQWLQGYYVQDDWKVTPRLTLNLGLRYELTYPFSDQRDRMGVLDVSDPSGPKLVLAGMEGRSSFDRSMLALDKNNFMPRFGLAYKLTDNLVVRAGYGIFYTLFEPLGDSEFLIANPPFSWRVNKQSSPTAPAVILQDGPPAGSLDLENASSLVFSGANRFPKTGSNQQWNLNVQWGIARDWLWEIGYSGAHGTHLAQRFDGNFSPPGPGDIDAKRPFRSAAIPGTNIIAPLGNLFFYDNQGNSIYHAMVTKVEKRFSSGYTLLGSYTFSKTIGDTCGGSAAGNAVNCGYRDLRDRSIERAADNQDIPHRLVLSGLYDLPFGRGRRYGSGWSSALDTIAGGWTLGSIVTWVSGAPYSIAVSGNPANIAGDTTRNSPNVMRDPYRGIEQTLQADFAPSAFAAPAEFTMGNAGRNIMRNRTEFVWDFSLLKNFQIWERLTLQFRFEAFQFTNTPRFGQAGATFGTSTFGQITSAETPRNLQLGLKLIW